MIGMPPSQPIPPPRPDLPPLDELAPLDSRVRDEGHYEY